jgi:ribosome-binding protein aMBF1 (putative translation factor)
MVEKFKRTSRTLNAEQKQEFDAIRNAAQAEFPPLVPAQGPSAKGRIALTIRAARMAQGLTLEQLASRSGFASADTVRDIEYGSDAKMSELTAIAAALGLSVELVSSPSS